MSLVAVRRVEKEGLVVVRQDVECGASKDCRHGTELSQCRQTEEESSWKKKDLQNRQALKNIKQEFYVYKHLVRASGMRTAGERGMSQRQKLSLGC